MAITTSSEGSIIDHDWAKPVQDPKPVEPPKPVFLPIYQDRRLWTPTNPDDNPYHSRR